MVCTRVALIFLVLARAWGLQNVDDMDPKEAQEEDLDEDDPEVDETTPMPEPFSHMYEDSDSVSRDVELRRGVAFHPQGTKPEVDLTDQEQFTTDSFFSQDPNIFGHCMLIRDLATPLRVGSAMIKMDSKLRGTHRHHHRHLLASNSSKANRPPGRFVLFGNRGSVETKINKPEEGEDQDKLPGKVLLPKGGVMDRDTGETVGTDGSVEDDVELEVNMFAYLRSVAGEVAVIPNGDIAKWSSKKKVPIAGYLCTTDQGPVLHTLPTPCLPTSIDENGEPFAPPVTSEDDAVGKPVSDPYHVWVGTTLLEFRSKPKAERFCKRLTKRIADDMGDAEWDAERLIPKEVQEGHVRFKFHGIGPHARARMDTRRQECSRGCYGLDAWRFLQGSIQ